METKRKIQYERVIYITLIIILIIYGMLKDNEGARAMIDSVKEAFSIILIP